jgi:hypothetical protein
MAYLIIGIPCLIFFLYEMAKHARLIEDDDIHAGYTIFLGFLSFIMIIFFCFNIETVYKIKLAPRVYIVDHLTDKLQGNNCNSAN